MSDINVVDPDNSFSGVLLANASFTGVFIDVTAYTSVTCLLSGDEIIDIAELQWSIDGITVIATEPFFANFSPISFVGGSITCHSTVRAPFFRVYVLNQNIAQGPLFSVTTLLRTGPHNAYVSPIIMPPMDSDDALTTKATMFARRTASGDPVYTQVLCDGNGILHVVPQPPTSGGLTTSVIASLTAVQMTSGAFDDIRDELTIFNDTERGSLYIRCFNTVSLTNFHYKIPPQHTWQLPYSWRLYNGQIWGIWDEADGTAYVREVF